MTRSLLASLDTVASYPLEGTHQAKPIRVKTNAFGLRDVGSVR